MKVLKTLWGLIVDDGRLASILLISLVVAAVVAGVHQELLGAIVIWLGLIVSLWVSIEHQLQKKIRK